MLRLLALNEIGTTDLIFFILCGVIVAVIIAVYYLIPVFNKKQYQEQRDNLKKREAAFKANKQMNSDAETENTMTETESTVKEE